MNVLALDLSLTATGYAIGTTLGTLPPPKGKDRGNARLDWILRQVLELAARGEADVAVIEGYSYGSKGRAIVSIGELGGLVRWGLYRRGIPYVEIAPGTLKKFATGRGDSKKPDMLAAAIKRLGYNPSNGRHDDNEVDALWLQQVGLHGYQLPGAATLPKAQLEAIAGVEWPDIRKAAAA